MSAPYRYSVTASDTDAGGIVYYVNYLKIIERAREALFAAHAASATALAEQGVALQVADCQLKYIASAKLDDELTVHSSLQALDANRAVLIQRVSCEEKPLVEALIALSCVSLPAGSVCALPQAVLAALASLAQVGVS